ncbi:MAG: FHA domain-containing protein [Anaerolineae bacterium]|nr:FHA domain-containing protein [Anaerolineae bacterium]
MTDEKKPDGEVEGKNQPASQPSGQRNPSESKEATTKSALASEEKPRKEAVSGSQVERSTEKLRVGDLAGLPDSLAQTYRGETGSAKYFRRLPVSMSSADLPPETPRWRIELIGLGSTIEPVGLEIVGDTVVGRGRVGTEPADLDLDMYGALEKGVSRRHGLLRPTTNHLYIIDLGSTNGTFHNGIPLGPGVARALKHNDTITLGRFSFTLKLIDGPSMHRTVEVGKPTAAPDVEGTDKTKPLEPLTPSAIKDKKASLSPPTFDPTSPGTTRLPEDEDTKPQPSVADEAKQPPAKAKSPIPDASSLIAGSRPATPQVSPTPEAKKPEEEVKSSQPDEKKPEEKPKVPIADVIFSKEVTKPLDPETRPITAKPPASEAKPAVVEDESPAKKTDTAEKETKPAATEDKSQVKEDNSAKKAVQPSAIDKSASPEESVKKEDSS